MPRHLTVVHTMNENSIVVQTTLDKRQVHSSSDNTALCLCMYVPCCGVITASNHRVRQLDQVYLILFGYCGWDLRFTYLLRSILLLLSIYLSNAPPVNMPYAFMEIYPSHFM